MRSTDTILGRATFAKLRFPILSSALAWIVMSLATSACIAEEPMAAKYLYTADYIRGEQELERALEKSPKDDQIRFGLGFLQVVRAFERLGQASYEYGIKHNVPLMMVPQLPIAQNPDPAPITYRMWRRICDDFLHDLNEAENTLSEIKDDNVKMTLKVADIKFDLDGDGQPESRFFDLIKRLINRRLEFLEIDPTFTVTFDRGDVAWLRAYCHFIAGGLDFILAIDLEATFDYSASDYFTRPKKVLTAEQKAKLHADGKLSDMIVSEPVRWHRFREHLLESCRLNHETWKYILAETDDDHEWLPNPKQSSVFGMRVRQPMIDQWLKLIDELSDLFEGKKMLPTDMFWKKDGRNFNVKTFLESPPEGVDFFKVINTGPAEKYFDKGPTVDQQVFIAALQAFDASPIPYIFWFN